MHARPEGPRTVSKNFRPFSAPPWVQLPRAASARSKGARGKARGSKKGGARQPGRTAKFPARKFAIIPAVREIPPPPRDSRLPAAASERPSAQQIAPVFRPNEQPSRGTICRGYFRLAGPEPIADLLYGYRMARLFTPLCPRAPFNEAPLRLIGPAPRKGPP